MKIAVNTRFLIHDKLEGVGRYSFEVLRRLVAERPQDQFFFFFDRPFNDSFIFGPNVKGFVINPPARHPFLFFLWFEFGVAPKLKELRADLFISPDGFLSLRSDVRTILVVHDIAHLHFPEHVPFFQRLYYSFFIPRFVRKAETIITVSNFSKKDLIEQYHIDPGKIDVSCNGPLDGLAPLSINKKMEARRIFADGKPYFLYVGAMHPRKNIGNLILAFEIFKTRTGAPHQLVLAGRKAWMQKEVDAIYTQSPFKKDIIFPGFVPDEELFMLYGGAFALVYVSLFEGFGIPILEGMKAGIPVITSNTSSMPEVGGEAVLTVDPRAPHAIADAMQSLFERPDLQTQLILKGQKQAKYYSWEKATDIINKAIEAERWK